MDQTLTRPDEDLQDWVASLDDAVRLRGKAWGERVLRQLQTHAQSIGVNLPLTSVTPYANTIPLELQPEYPGDREMEKRLENLLRWNAMIMVQRGNVKGGNQGGHIATFASCITLYEVGQNHFFRGEDHPHGPDMIYFQGHASPGMYARAFLEGRFSEEHLAHFRKESGPEKGISSYPHPWLMPDFWQFPTVSMGLGPITAIYHARFIRYLEDRGLKEPTDQKVWCFIGDGETDEPETLGAINLASREKLDNLIFVINCNLQRLDGPVRGNDKIIQELEGTFRGSGWKVLKVIWGSDWDPIFARDPENLIIERAGRIPDGEFQKYSVEPGWYMRENFFGKDENLLDLVRDIPDDQLKHLSRGGHDPFKVHAAYKAAMQGDGRPTVILVKTIKGFGMGKAGEGLNIAHNAKVMPPESLKRYRDLLEIEVTDDQLEDLPYVRPHEKSAEIRYLLDRRARLGGFLPKRNTSIATTGEPEPGVFEEFNNGSDDRPVSTTMAFMRLLSRLLKDKELGEYIVPICPDESRTLGLDAMYRQVGIYSHVGQLYEPVDRENVLYYKEAQNGQILEEGITEAGSMSTFIAAGTAASNHSVPSIPIYMYYSMFGFQRTCDQAWLAGDARARGFLIGGTAGRTTLNGEGLQHQDGHSHLIASAVPTIKAYDPAFAYEVAAITKEGIREMSVEGESVIYYITVQNENYVHPPMPEDAEEGILRGIYRYSKGKGNAKKKRVHLFGSGSIILQAIEAQKLLEEDFGIPADIWSVTSYTELRKDALHCERWNMLHPDKKPMVPYIQQALDGEAGPFVAVSDYVKALPDGITKWMPGRLISLGTDGFGRSDTRPRLRKHFEINPQYVALGAIWGLAQDGVLPAKEVKDAIKKLEIDPEKIDPLLA